MPAWTISFKITLHRKQLHKIIRCIFTSNTHAYSICTHAYINKFEECNQKKKDKTHLRELVIKYWLMLLVLVVHVPQAGRAGYDSCDEAPAL